MSATLNADGEKKADALVGELRRIYTVNAVKVGVSPERAAAILLLGPMAPAAALVPDSSEHAAGVKQLKDLQPQIKSWETTLRSYAKNGKKASGLPYSWRDWAEHGKTLAESCSYIGGESWNASPMLGLVAAVGQTGADVVKVTARTADVVTHPALWPWWVKPAIGAGVGLVVLAVAAPYLGPVLKRVA